MKTIITLLALRKTGCTLGTSTYVEEHFHWKCEYSWSAGLIAAELAGALSDPEMDTEVIQKLKKKGR